MLKPDYRFLEFCSFLDECIDEARAIENAPAIATGPSGNGPTAAEDSEPSPRPSGSS
jgi:hypothetical protein